MQPAFEFCSIYYCPNRQVTYFQVLALVTLVKRFRSLTVDPDDSSAQNRAAARSIRCATNSFHSRTRGERQMDRGEASRDGSIDHLRIAPLRSAAVSIASTYDAVDGSRSRIVLNRLKVGIDAECIRGSPWWNTAVCEDCLELSRKRISQVVEQSRICRLADTKTCQCQR